MRLALYRRAGAGRHDRSTPWIPSPTGATLGTSPRHDEGADVTTALIRGAVLEDPEARSSATTARTVQTVEPAPARRDDVGRAAPSSPPIDIVDQWGMQSFPASDPPANW